jgi:hypothetical protein
VAVYRESPPVWRRYLPLIVGIVIVIAALLILLGLNQLSMSVKPTVDVVSNALNLISQSVDVFDIEYPKVAQGTPVAQTGAAGALERAEGVFKGAESALKAIDPAATAALADDLAKLRKVLNGSATDITPIINDANQQLFQLHNAASTPSR